MAIVLQSDQRTPFIAARNERACPVHRIQNPGETAGGWLLAKFFANDSIIRSLAFDDGADRFLGAFVSDRYRIEHAAFREAFVDDLYPLAKIRSNHLGGSICKLVGKSHAGRINAH